jgi:hypothetical protein
MVESLCPDCARINLFTLRAHWSQNTRSINPNLARDRDQICAQCPMCMLLSSIIETYERDSKAEVIKFSCVARLTETPHVNIHKEPKRSYSIASLLSRRPVFHPKEILAKYDIYRLHRVTHMVVEMLERIDRYNKAPILYYTFKDLELYPGPGTFVASWKSHYVIALIIFRRCF